jgi:hypothetical protein
MTRDKTGQPGTRPIAKIDILEVIERLDVRPGHSCHYRGRAFVVTIVISSSHPRQSIGTEHRAQTSVVLVLSGPCFAHVHDEPFDPKDNDAAAGPGCLVVSGTCCAAGSSYRHNRSPSSR